MPRTHLAPGLFRAPALLAVTLLTACSWFYDGIDPPGLRIGEKATENSPGVCPPVAGVFYRSRSDIGTVVSQMLPHDIRPTWTALVVEGNANTQLQVKVSGSDDAVENLTWRRDHDYDCRAGWLRPRDADEMFPSFVKGSERTYRHDFLITTDDRGRLVGRHSVLDFSEFTVWCGDGCKGFPIPWTIRRTVTWSFLPERPEPVVAGGDGDEGTAEEHDPVSERLAAEEAALEQGPPGPAIERWLMNLVRQRLARTRIEGMGPHLEGITVSIVVPDTLDIPVVVDHLRSTHGVRDAWHDRLTRGIDPEGRHHTAIRVLPDTAVFMASKASR